jgi:branched-chain amino acid transport system substrate-binding protein
LRGDASQDFQTWILAGVSHEFVANSHRIFWEVHRALAYSADIGRSTRCAEGRNNKRGDKVKYSLPLALPLPDRAIVLSAKRNPFRAIRRTVLAASLSVLAAACALPAMAATAAAADPYVINSILPLSGGASFLGKGEKRALEIVEKTVNAQGGINGRKIHFEVSDDQSSPQQAVQIASRLVAQKVPVIVGPSTVGECNAIAPLLRNNTVLYCASPGIHPEKGAYVYTSYISTKDLITSTVRYLRLRGWTKIAMLTSTDASGQDAAAGIKAALKSPENKGVSLVAEATFNPSNVSVSAQVEQIKAANPQALIAWSVGAPMTVALKAIVQAGLDVPVATSGGNMTHAQMAEYASFLPKQLYIGSSEWPPHDGVIKLAPEVEARQKVFYDAYAAAGLAPEGPSTYIWDVAMITIDALRATGLDAAAKDIQNHISSLQGYAGVNGIYDFVKEPQRGLNEGAAVMTLWDPAGKTWKIVSKPRGEPIQ